MNKISAIFTNKKAFIAYLMGGDPSLEATREFILALAKEGVDLIEIGIPFSDPIAEGEIIQNASERALKAGATVNKLFTMLESLKGEISIPLVLMTYVNPVFNFGYENFAKRCVQAGISGLIVPDLPFEEEGEIAPILQKNGLALIRLIAPTSFSRAKSIAKGAEGFIYLVSSMGVTGVRQEFSNQLASLVTEIRSESKTPIAIGFGIHSGEQAFAMSQLADGIIIGSAIVKKIAEHGKNATPHLAKYAAEIRAALDA